MTVLSRCQYIKIILSRIHISLIRTIPFAGSLSPVKYLSYTISGRISALWRAGSPFYACTPPPPFQHSLSTNFIRAVPNELRA